MNATWMDILNGGWNLKMEILDGYEERKIFGILGLFMDCNLIVPPSMVSLDGLLGRHASIATLDGLKCKDNRHGQDKAKDPWIED